LTGSTAVARTAHDHIGNRPRGFMEIRGAHHRELVRQKPLLNQQDRVGDRIKRDSPVVGGFTA
jgi:hypothetical protein